MSADIVPFPIMRRHHFIARQINRVSGLNAGAAERHIHLHLCIQAEAMRRKGIAENLVARELKSMEFAFRKALCRAAMTTPFGAS